jgi:hypothetical protein
MDSMMNPPMKSMMNSMSNRINIFFRRFHGLSVDKPGLRPLESRRLSTRLAR